MLDALRADGEGASLRRYRGGFWATAATPMLERGVPEWWVDIRTIEAMERRGLLRRLNVWPEYWRDERGLCESR